MRASRIRGTHCCLGAVMRPHPFLSIVRDFRSAIFKKLREQLLKKKGQLTDAGAKAVVLRQYETDRAVAWGVEAADDGAAVLQPAGRVGGRAQSVRGAGRGSVADRPAGHSFAIRSGSCCNRRKNSSASAFAAVRCCSFCG